MARHHLPQDHPARDPGRHRLRGRAPDRLPRHRAAGAGACAVRAEDRHRHAQRRPAVAGRLIGRLMLAARGLREAAGLRRDGYRLVMNCNGDGGQTVFQVHLHLLAGAPLGRFGYAEIQRPALAGRALPATAPAAYQPPHHGQPDPVTSDQIDAFAHAATGTPRRPPCAEIGSRIRRCDGSRSRRSGR